jgi:signal transduction histidine kinase
MELRHHMFLELFGVELAESLMRAAEIQPVAEGAVVFREGDAADSIYLVLQGIVRLVKRDATGRELPIAIVKENDFFGELGVLDGLPRSAGAVVAGRDTVLARIPSSAVIAACEAAGSQGTLRVAFHIIRKRRESNARYVEERNRRERLAVIGEMAGTIVHDLRNPFAVIQMATDLILRRANDATTKENCEFIQKQMNRLQGMVEEILEFSRGQATLHKTATSLETLFAGLSRLNNVYRAQGIQLNIRPLARQIVVDEGKLLRVLQNLINNSVEAFAGRPGTVTVNAEDCGNAVVLSVADNGPGLPEEFKARIFEPFATFGKTKGTGLGMAIAKSIVEAHGGQLTFESAPGQGTTFFIRLPV